MASPEPRPPHIETELQDVDVTPSHEPQVAVNLFEGESSPTSSTVLSSDNTAAPVDRECEQAPAAEIQQQLDSRPADLASVEAGNIDSHNTHQLNDEQEDRLRAYDEMGEMAAVTLMKKSREVMPEGLQKGMDHVFGFLDKTKNVLTDNVPRPVTDIANFAGANVKVLASTTANIIENAPDMLVSVIPDRLMSKDTKKLLFVDFNNTLRSFFHTNILTLPFVFNETGVVTGLILCTFLACCSLYATETFFAAKNLLTDPTKVVVYGDVPRMTFGDWYPSLNIFYGVIHLISFQAFAAHNMEVMLRAMGFTKGTYLLGLLIPGLLAAPLVLMKEAKYQRPLAILSNFIVLLCVTIMMFYFPFKPRHDIVLSTDGNRLIIAIGICVYAFTGIGSSVPVERTMEPRKYIKLLRVAVPLSLFLLVGFGLSGYYSYGQSTCAVITLSLQNGQTKTALSVLLFIASVAIIPQQVFPFAEVMDRRLLGYRFIPGYWDRWGNFARLGTMVGCAFIAYAIPYYGLILSIGGAVGCGLLGLIIPAGLDYSVRKKIAFREKRGVRWYEYIVIVLMGGFGMFALVVGVLFSLYDMWQKLQANAAANAGGHGASCG